VDRRHTLSALNAEAVWPRGLTLGSAHWLNSRTVGHVAASGLRLCGEPYTAWPGHVSAPDPRLGLIKVRVLPLPGSRDPVCEWPGPPPPPRGPGPVRGVWFVPVEVLGLAWRSGLCIQGSRPTVDTLEYIVSSSYVAAPEPPTRWGRALFCHMTRDSRMDSAPSYCSKGRAGKKARARRAGSGSQQLGSARTGSTLRTSPSRACFSGS
jgi:hypothetical protein